MVPELTLQSKEVLNLIARETAAILLNKKVHQEKIAPNELCCIPDLLYAKNPNSLVDSLAWIKETKDSTTYALTLLNKKIIIRHVSQIVSTKANYNTTQFANIDPFQITYVEDKLLPSDFESRFNEPLLKFHDDNITNSTILDL